LHIRKTAEENSSELAHQQRHQLCNISLDILQDSFIRTPFIQEASHYSYRSTKFTTFLSK
jgi:hypothetical protein